VYRKYFGTNEIPINSQTLACTEVRRSLPGTSYYRPSSLDFPSILRKRFMDGAKYGHPVVLFPVHTIGNDALILFRSRFLGFQEPDWYRTRLVPGKTSDGDIRRTSSALNFFFLQQHQHHQQHQSHRIITSFQTLPSLSEQHQQLSS
jgi:hypothetical protein